MSLPLEKGAAPLRNDLDSALTGAWNRLGEAGTWWTGEERVALAAETRHAARCRFCARCTQALSPFTEEGEHDHLGQVPAPAVELVHRLVNHSGRLTPSWFERVIGAGLSEPAYVEAVGVAVTVIAIDTFHRGLGLPEPPLPRAEPGEPIRRLPDHVRKRFSWVPTVSPKQAGADLKKAWWPDGRERYVPRIHQAMSLVPREVIAFLDLSEALYLPARAVMDFSTDLRAISRAQMELLAARMSALNECFY